MYILRESSEDFNLLDTNLDTLVFESYEFMLNLTESVMEMVETAMNQEHQYIMSEDVSILNEASGSIVTKLKEMFMKMLNYIKNTVVKIFMKLSGRNKKIVETAENLAQETKAKADSFNKISYNQDDDILRRFRDEIKPHQGRLKVIERELSGSPKPLAILDSKIAEYQRDISKLSQNIERAVASLANLDTQLQRPGRDNDYYEDIKHTANRHRHDLDNARTNMKDTMSKIANVKDTQDKVVTYIQELRNERNERIEIIHQIGLKYRNEKVGNK